ncbi:glycosyltransferase [Alicyclobacillus ferrooxydans]|uniref:Glycosyltransferase 2-like domain-containing protein n=1 Tax=Alicyclobacillus ferrooxydans TaxID=471514 RepID=A0A0P9CS77_9BACL|nr:glycosyltransferase [Alicyclobacillus ferrooxydans]KPV42447.1 hypothetical protein AN477_17820 [Alicyclobacillus ferrooxydans]
MEKCRVKALVVTRDRERLLARCLERLLNQSYPVEEILIIDNASSDGTQDLVSSLEGGRVAYHRLQSNQGGAAGYAAGLSELTQSDWQGWVWMMDDDAEPIQNALEELVRYIETNELRGCGALASAILTPGGIRDVTHRGWFNLSSLRQCPSPHDLYEKQDPFKVGYSSFVGLLLNTQAIRTVAMPRSDFFIWFDDVEYCLRLGEFYDIFVVPSSLVVHPNPLLDSSRRFSYGEFWKMYYDVRNTLIVGLEYGDSSAVWRYFLAIGLRRILGVVLFDDHKLSRIRILLRGWIDGLRNRTGKTLDPQAFVKRGA